MIPIRIAAAALNQTPLDWKNNRSNISRAIDEARRQEASILCLPEMCISGYGCEDAFLSAGTIEMSIRILQDVADLTEGMVVSFGLPLLFGGAIYNAVALVADRKILGLVCKQNLAGEGIHYEPRWFKPWPVGVRSEIVIGDDKYPIGDLTFDIGGIVLGFEICEDAWVANRPGSSLARRCVDIIMNPSASHFAFGKQEVRRRFVLEGSRAFSVSYVYANLLGNEAGRAIYDGGTMIGSNGNMMAEGRRFSYADYHVTSTVIDVEATRMNRARTASFHPQVPGGADMPIIAAFDYPDIMPLIEPLNQAPWEFGPHVKEEEFARAVAIGLYDYLRKSRSRGFVVSLSGGADSSTVAVLIWISVMLGCNEIGLDAFIKKIGYIPGIRDVSSPKALVERLLVCVYQSTRNSGEVTRTAAKQVAAAIGAEFLEFNVDALVEGYVAMVAQGIGREPNWEQDDLALQNIQARSRAPSVWLLANIRGALLLATSNRSEAAVGYATMDGDTCGGLSPIAGIDKAYLRRWLRWMEQADGGPFCPDPLTGEPIATNLPALKYVNYQQPTAELRPQHAGQTDEADLMPYDILDAIEKAAIRDKRSPRNVFHWLRAQRPDVAPGQLFGWIERFFTLWTRNQWKRERYAPSFHLDDENLDPKTWCRFPILSGGFRTELAELRKYVEEL